MAPKVGMNALLELQGLYKHYPITGGVLKRQIATVKALDGVDLTIRRGECLGLVGESGCGKTTTGKTLVGLHPPTSGRLLYYRTDKNGGVGESVDVTGAGRKRLKRFGLGGRMQMVFQDPATSLNPRMLVKHIVAEPIKAQQRMGGRELEEKVLDLLELVGLTRDHMLRYPHEFSGGQRQRIALARAVSTDPEFVVLDEPTSALDVSVQAQILTLLQNLQARLNLTYLFVTHHLLVVKYISHRTAVMYLGKVVELADTADLFSRPAHPYTLALLSGIPIPDVEHKPHRIVLTGDVPSPVNPPAGCRFHTRCPFVMDRCREEEPALADVGTGRLSACHRSGEMDRLTAQIAGD